MVALMAPCGAASRSQGQRLRCGCHPTRRRERNPRASVEPGSEAKRAAARRQAPTCMAENRVHLRLENEQWMVPVNLGGFAAGEAWHDAPQLWGRCPVLGHRAGKRVRRPWLPRRGYVPVSDVTSGR